MDTALARLPLGANLMAHVALLAEEPWLDGEYGEDHLRHRQHVPRYL